MFKQRLRCYIAPLFQSNGTVTIPDVLRLDEWGYAQLIEAADVPERLEQLARRAISECPVGAILEAPSAE